MLRNPYLSNLGLPPLPGRYFPMWEGGNAATTAFAAVNIIYFYPFFLPFPFLVTTLAIRVITLGAGSSVKFAIWADSPVSHKPLGAPMITDNTGQDTSTTGEKETNVTDTLLPAGWYWGGSKCTGTPPICQGPAANTPGWAYWLPCDTVSVHFTAGISLADTYSNNMPTIAEGQAFTTLITASGPATLILKS